MPLENGRADERVSRGQTNERAVCVCEVVSEEMGARRPPLPTAVVCPPGHSRRLRLAITATSLPGRVLMSVINGWVLEDAIRKALRKQK